MCIVQAGYVSLDSNMNCQTWNLLRADTTQNPEDLFTAKKTLALVRCVNHGPHQSYRMGSDKFESSNK